MVVRWSRLQHALVTLALLVLPLDAAGPVGGSAPRGGRGLHDGTVPGAYPTPDGRQRMGTTTATDGGNRLPIGPVASLAKTALHFDGDDDFALVRQCKSLPTKTLTAAAWVRVTNHKSYNRILSHKWVGFGWNLYTDGSGVARFGIGQNNADFAAAKILLRDRWHYVAGTYDGEHIRIFVDGVAGSQTALHDATIDGEGYLSIGGAEWDPFQGMLDDVRVWDHARDAAQIRRDMVTPPEADDAGLVGHWQFDEGTGLVAYDASPHGNHAELGTGRRAPRWVQSGAQIVVPCTTPGRPLTLTLQGRLDGGIEPRAYVTTLPERGSLQQLGVEGGEAAMLAITAVPTEVRAASRRVLYTPLKEEEQQQQEKQGHVGEAGSAAYCDRFEYRVHDGQYTSRESATVLVEVVPELALCGTLAVATAGCWGRRTQVDIVRAAAAPPAVSIIIPLFNQGALLGDTLAAVAAQTFSDWEVVVVDDGSTDDSPSIARALVEKYTAKGMRMRLLHKSNGGLADARNAGIRAARAQYILPLDGDDLILPPFLEQAMALLRQDNSTNLVIANLKGFGAWEYSWRLPDYDPLDLLYTNMFHCSALFHRRLWDAVPGGYPTTTLFGYEDWAFWIHAEARVGIVPRYIQEEQFLYRIRADSMHQSLLQNQESSLASVRLLHPTLYPMELVTASHDYFLTASDKVRALVAEKVEKFPSAAAAHLMAGLVAEGQGRSPHDGHAHGYYWAEAAESFAMAAELAEHEDWQPRWRLALLQRRMGNYSASNATFAALLTDFTGLDTEVQALTAQ